MEEKDLIVMIIIEIGIETHQPKGEERHHALNQNPQAKEKRNTNLMKKETDPIQIHHIPRNPPAGTLDQNTMRKTKSNKTKREKSQTPHQAPHLYPAKARAILVVHHQDHLIKKLKSK